MTERRTIETIVAGPYDPVALLPDVQVVKIGGQSILDRGRVALFPILDEIVTAKQRHKLFVLSGGGTRARHLYALAAELELPTGVFAAVGGSVPRQNARMLQMLLARHGGVHVEPADFGKLPGYFASGCLPIMPGMPPFGLWEQPAKGTRVPPHRTDTGAFLTAEALGAPRVIYVKDEDGLYEADPKKDPEAAFIERISAAELLERDLVDLALERRVVEYLPRTRFCKEVQILNGLKPGQLTRALAGEDVGSIIHA